jgi:hypothetical protein
MCNKSLVKKCYLGKDTKNELISFLMLLETVYQRTLKAQCIIPSPLTVCQTVVKWNGCKLCCYILCKLKIVVTYGLERLCCYQLKIQDRSILNCELSECSISVPDRVSFVSWTVTLQALLLMMQLWHEKMLFHLYV